MVYELITYSFRYSLFEKEQITWEIKMVLKLFTTFIVVAAILASPTWSYHSSIYRVHWGKSIMIL